MRVFVPEIPDEGLSLRFCGNDARWEGLLGMDMASLPDGQIFLERRGKDVFLRGKFSASVRLSCSRCLEGYSLPMELSIRYTLRPLDRDTRKASEEELVREDLEYGYYEGDVIQLDRLIEEHVLLNLPMKPLCRVDCRGICPRCGSNRNEAECDCSLNQAESPFDVLKTRVS